MTNVAATVVAPVEEVTMTTTMKRETETVLKGKSLPVVLPVHLQSIKKSQK